MTREAFLDWAACQDGRFEFDGFGPVGMVGSTISHARIAQKIWRTIDRQLVGTGCEAFIRDGAVATVGDALRFPDVTVTCSPVAGRDRVVAAPVLVFEVLSPSTERNDKIVKLEEYRAVRSMVTYVIVEQDYVGLTVFRRWEGDQWVARALSEGQVLRIDQPALTLPLAEIYAGVAFKPDQA